MGKGTSVLHRLSGRPSTAPENREDLRRSGDAAVLEVRNLTISVTLSSGRRVNAVEDVSFSVGEGGTLGLVGESGSGKTLSCLAVMGLLPPGARVEHGEILFHGEDLVPKSERAMRRLRGSEISMVLQDPMTALDPMFTIESQLSEPLRQHRHLRGAKLTEAMVSSLEQVQLSGARERLHQFPHQLSGGMRQRVVSAIGLSGRPSLLIADEPTTALDAMTQAKYLQLLNRLQEETGFALVLVAHDLNVVRHVCERVCVMYAGQIVERGRSEEVFTAPDHPYTRALLRAIPVLSDEMVLEAIEGQAPGIEEEIEGCRFAERCRFSRSQCFSSTPGLTARGSDRSSRCWGTEADGWIDS